MSDFVAYRFPDGNVEQKVGRFTLGTDKVESGFIISDFKGDNTFFLADALDGDWPVHFHCAKEKPYACSSREYLLQAHSFLNGMKQFGVKKGVFSRVKKVSFSVNNSKALFEMLCQHYPKAFIYLVSSELVGTWIGATPEVLMESHKDCLFTVSLAGTKLVSDTSAWGEKERLEQTYVTSFIEEKLTLYGARNIEKIGPYDLCAGPIKHLKTDFSADLAFQKHWSLLKELHPSPAVSGLPRQEALDLIALTENHDRLLYTGFIGVYGEQSARFYVNLRCAQLQGDTAYLYVGGGFTDQSIPELEFDETENKSKTLSSFMKQCGK